MLTGVHAQSIDKTPPAPRLALPDGAPLQPSTHRPTSDLPPNEGVGSLRGLAEGRGCKARVPVESPPRQPPETVAAVPDPAPLANHHRRPETLGGKGG
jgi:hypothetical protein